MTLSVAALVPTYDRPEELRGAIRSVLDQHWPGPVSVLVGDDGGRAAPVVASIGDPRVRLFEHPVRLGMAGNWNFLLDKADADVVGLLMDDDRWLPGFLDATAGALVQQPDVDVAFTNHVFVAGADVTARKCALPPGRHDNFAAAFLRERPVAISGAVFRRALWPAVRPLPDTPAADMVLYGRLAELGAVFWYDDRPLMSYAVHATQFSQSPAFRDAGVRAWDALRFSDPLAERERQRLLREALVARAVGVLRAGDVTTARADLARAGTLPGGVVPRERVVRALAAAGPVAAPLLRARRALLGRTRAS